MQVNKDMLPLNNFIFHVTNVKLEDLKVLKRSPHLLNNVKIGQGQRYYLKILCFTIYGYGDHFIQVT